MLYKYYRFFLIIKIALLIAGGFILFTQWSSSGYNGGTTIVVYGSGQIDPYAAIGIANQTPGPYALLHAEQERLTLHIPRTYDTGYILQYLRNGFPIVEKEFTSNSYFTECKVTINILGNETKITPCQKYGLHADIWAIVFILIGVLL